MDPAPCSRCLPGRIAVASNVYFADARTRSKLALVSAPALPCSGLERASPQADKLRALHPDVDWIVQLRHGWRLGAGTRDYSFVKVAMA